MIYRVEFENTYEDVSDREAADEQAAIAVALERRTSPRYCRLHEGLRRHRRDAEIGQMGRYWPPAPTVKAVRRMREVYVGGGYCLVAA